MQIKCRTETKGKPTVTETFELPREVAGLVEAFTKDFSGSESEGARLDRIAELLAELYDDAHQFADQARDVRRSNRMRKQIGLPDREEW